MERQAGSRSKVRPIDSIRVKSKYQAERCINNRRHNLKLHSSARPEAGVRTGQKSDAFGLNMSFTIYELTLQLVFLPNPGIARIEEWRHRHNIANERDSIFEVQDTLAVTPDIHDVIEWAVDSVAGFRVDSRDVSHHRSNWADRTEIKASDVEIAAEEESFVERHSRV